MIGGKPSVLYKKTYAFGVRVVRAYQLFSLERRAYVLSKQLLRCGISIRANVAEANGARSNADFSAKISISYTECLKTRYWLNLLHDTNYLTTAMFSSLHKDADELARILFVTLRSINRIRKPLTAN